MEGSEVSQNQGERKVSYQTEAAEQRSWGRECGQAPLNWQQIGRR